MLDQYTSKIFEDVCCEYLRKLNKQNLLPFRFTKIGRWWNKNNEIDIMATNSNKDEFIIGECKYKNSAFNMAELNALMSKFKPSNMESKLHYYLFSKNGFTDAVYKIGIEKGMNRISLDEIL